MSRVAKIPVTIPQGLEVTQKAETIYVKKDKDEPTSLFVTALVTVKVEDQKVYFSPKNEAVEASAMCGTARQLFNNMVQGITKGFERKLTLVGVGFKAQALGNKLNLSVGFSHPVEKMMPEGISVETPSQTEITLKGKNSQQVGQIAAEIRAIRPPELYKGKGIRYANERILLKETKKK
jgi:large subunit ribosomal protein L6